MGYAFIGFGEAGTAFVTNWSEAAKASTRGFDIKSKRPGVLTERYDSFGVRECFSSEEAVRDADVVFSLVTADQAATAAQEAASSVQAGMLFLDCNSCSPGTKRSNRDVIERAGARYVDVAVMAPVHPALNKVPLHLSGPHADAAAQVLSDLGMTPTVLEGDVGYASSVKMIRSIMIKGMEALTAQCFLAATKAGVDDRILASLEKSFPGFGWEARGGYNLERMIQHGIRRAAEMEEVAITVSELGLPNEMVAATVIWQRRIGELQLTAASEDYRELSEILNAKLASD
ncbi:MAG: DUF1932 domain-containing protein [Pseudomonadota bacterium]